MWVQSTLLSAHAIFINVMNFEIGRLQRKRDNTDVDGAVFDALQNLVTEIAIDADVDLRVSTLKFRKNVGEEIEASSLIGAKDDWTLDDVAAIGDDLNGFVAQAKQAFGVIEEDFTGGSELDGLGGTIQEFGAISLLELTNLRTDGRL